MIIIGIVPNPVRMLCCVAFIMVSCIPCFAQVITDSLAEDFRSFVAKNFSRYRTANFQWESKLAHDYSFSHNTKDMEKGRKRNLHTIRFSTMVPLLKLRNMSLYANIRYDCYKFDTASAIFHEDAYDYYAGGFNGSYYMSLFGRPFILSADISVDGWDKGWGMMQGRMSAIVLIKNTERTALSVGLMGMTLFNSVPVMPVITYWHRFDNPDLSVDITLPSQLYMRYQMRNQRISVGALMSSDNFYLKPGLEGMPEVCYYSEAVIKPEIHYEYIINRHFYLSFHAGLSVVMKGGLYTKSRKGIRMEGENEIEKDRDMVKQERSPVPFFNVGVSYSLFR